MERIEPDDATETDQTEADQTEADLLEEDPSEPPDHNLAGGGFERWRRESALGAVGTGVARGLQAVFAPPVNQPVIVASVPGDPPGEDERLRVILDPDDPTKSVAIMPTSADPAQNDLLAVHDEPAGADEPGGNAPPS